MHPRNKNFAGYDLDALSQTSATLAKYLRLSPTGEKSIDFANAAAVKALNRAILMHHYGVRGWQLPTDYLCPPIPGRADAIHTLADLLGESLGQIPHGPHIHLLDIGTGANLVYPLIGHAEYGWHFVGTDIEPGALENARQILAKNPEAAQHIQVREQTRPDHIFKGILRNGEYFDLTLCNPPFHESPEDVAAASRRKWNQLGKKPAGPGKPHLNFGGGDHELWCEGGERGFLSRMIEESAGIAKRVFWFSSLVSKADHLALAEKLLKRVKVRETRILPMDQGQKQSRLIAWTFLDPGEQRGWRDQRWRAAHRQTDVASTAENEKPAT